MPDELVDLLDGSGKKTGKAVMKSEAHKKGLWHEAVHVWIFNSAGEVLLQHRSPEKILFPNLWDISVAGHMASGERPDDVAVREAKEELGLNLDRKLLKKACIFKVSAKASDSMTNNELIHLYTYRLSSKPEIVCQPGEVDQAKFILLSELESDLADDEKAKKYPISGKFYGEAIKAIRKELGL